MQLLQILREEAIQKREEEQKHYDEYIRLKREATIAEEKARCREAYLGKIDKFHCV